MEWIELDGTHGGGQLLRSALSLSLCTGIGFHMTGIRGARPQPGLMRQHLAAVLAAVEVGNGHAEGAVLGATSLRFTPGAITPGDYTFAIGSAGSTMLVLQTVLPALWRCAMPSRLVLRGGTHNPMAPSADYIAHCYLPALCRMGVQATLQLEVAGFHPVGGGEAIVHVQPCIALRPTRFEERGALQQVRADILLSGIPEGIGRREQSELMKRLVLPADAVRVHQLAPAPGPGNAVRVTVEHTDHTEVFGGTGARGVSAEQVAARVAGRVRQYLRGTACVAEPLSDQLLLPMALAGGGSFSTATLSDHLLSNARLIERFLPVRINWQGEEGDWRVTVAPRVP